MYLLFQKERCPYCQMVRQALAERGLSYVLVAAEEGAPAQDVLEKLGGKKQVPFLVDLDKGKMLYESADIIAYLDQA